MRLGEHIPQTHYLFVLKGANVMSKTFGIIVFLLVLLSLRPKNLALFHLKVDTLMSTTAAMDIHVLAPCLFF